MMRLWYLACPSPASDAGTVSSRSLLLKFQNCGEQPGLLITRQYSASIHGYHCSTRKLGRL
jgi:hypothetical protein